MNTLMHGDTRYYGMWITREVQSSVAYYWIIDAHGNEEYYGIQAPTEEQIDAYAKCARGW